MRKIARKIKDLRMSKGLNQSEFAKEVGGVDQATVSRWEQGRQKPTFESVTKLADMAGVTPREFMDIPEPGKDDRSRAAVVTGSIQAGAWEDSPDWPDEDQYLVSAPIKDDYRDYPIFAREVAGSSMNRIYPDGSIVYIVPLHSLGRGPANGERVVVQRVSADGQYECTLKEYVIGADGRVWLWPRSDDPQHQAPIEYTAGARKIDRVEIIGIVITSVVNEPARAPA